MNIFFAPIQGYTEAAYRNAHATLFGGVDTYYTPFVRLEKGSIRNKDVREIEPGNNQVGHLIPQLLGNEIDKIETILALFIEKGYREVDINMGCPFPILAKRHNGSGILPFPDEVKELLKIVQRHPEVEFSVKMRLGWEKPDECLMLLPLLNELPLKQITLHPRVGKQQYKGDVDLNSFKTFAQGCHHPLVYNGDLKTTENIDQICSLFPTLAGVMIGRGLLENPALAWEYKEGKLLATDEKKNKLLQMHQSIFNRYEQQLQGGDIQLLNKMKTFWDYSESLIDHKEWKAIHKSSSLEKYRTAVSNIRV